MVIDYDGPVPVYRQVAAILRQRIESGEYQPGRRLPSVRGLVQEFGVAELTARKALRVLVADKVAVMSPGIGTFVERHDSDRQCDS
jgi:GntR family transcriptional regulator